MPSERLMRCVLTLDRQSSMFCACVRWSVDVNRMERVDLTKKGYMMLVFSVRKKKLHAKQTDATRTDRLSEAITRPGRYPSRIQGTSQGRFCIHFIDVLFRPSHHLVDTAQPNKKKGVMVDKPGRRDRNYGKRRGRQPL